MSDVATVPVSRKATAAIALRLAGASYAEVAEALEFSSARDARHVVENALAAQAGDPHSRENLRVEATLRLERLLRGAWAKATNPDSPEHLPAAKFALAAVDRIIRLHGLDAPTEISVHTPTASEIDRWVANVTQTSVADLKALESKVVIDTDEAEPA